MIKKSMLICAMAILALSACGEKKAKEVNVDAAVDKASTEMSTKVSASEAEIKAAKKKLKDSLRKVDSLEQVKSHGHAH